MGLKIANLEIRIERNAIYTFCVMVILLMIVTAVIGLLSGDIEEMSLQGAFFVALVVASFHYFAQFIHMLGHALAAWMTGYPKSGMVFLYIFAMSLYPSDEPSLPDRIHIQRSLGGPIAFALLLVMVTIFWANSRDAASWTIRYLSSYMLFDIVLLFAISALISDGVLFILRKEWRTPTPENQTPK